MLPAGITVVNNIGQIIFANNKAVEILELSKEAITSEFFNAPVWIIKDFDGNDFPVENLPFNLILKNKKPVYNLRHTIFTGEKTKYLSINASPLFDDAENEVEGMIASFEDITELILNQRALLNVEREYHLLFDSMTEIIVRHKMIFDENGKPVDYQILDCNPAFNNLIGLKKEDIQNKIASEFYQMSPPPFFNLYSKVAETGAPEQFEIYYKPMDKKFIISAVSTKKGYFDTITMDITYLKKIEDDLQKLINELSVKNEDMESLLYAASHDLRSPLINIQGFAKRIEKTIFDFQNKISETRKAADTGKLLEIIDSFENSKIERSLNYIYTSSNKMDVLINGLLKVSRLGRQQLNIENIEMNDLLNNIKIIMAQQIQESAAEIEFSGLLPCRADKNFINQIFSNLIDNAIKYRKQEIQPRIKINSEIKDEFAVYCVEDNGIGISSENQEKIWRIFYRINTDNKVTGEGLGLTIVNQIVKRNGGKIFVESREGDGSRFFIWLPRADEN